MLVRSRTLSRDTDSVYNRNENSMHNSQCIWNRRRVQLHRLVCLRVGVGAAVSAGANAPIAGIESVSDQARVHGVDTAVG